jgi:hypothetical protein
VKAVLVALVVLHALPARAQECHPLPAAHVPGAAPREAKGDPTLGGYPIGVRAGFGIEAAAIDDGLGRSGSYRGAVTSMEVAALGARARVSLAAYDISWGQRGRGLGDLHVAVQRAVTAVGATNLGISLAATLPTGDVADELGMGHPMAMPAVWGKWAGERSSLLASVVYGTMLGGHHHHGSPAPVPSPMNAEEIAAALRAGRTFGRTELSTSVSGAMPIGEGAARAAVGAGARWLLGATELAVDL